MPQIDVNGTSLHYESHGTGEETILFSHGLLFDHSMYAHQIEHLKDRFRCVAYDHRGQGGSAAGDKPLDMDTLYEDAAALIEALGIAPVHFVGLSMGGFVGLRLAARRPELIRSLVLIDTSAEPEPNVIKYRALVGIVKLLGIKPVVSQTMPVMFGKSFLKDPARRGELAHWLHFMGKHKKSITSAVEAVIDREGVSDELAGIRCPTLIMVGDEDVATTPDRSERLHAAISGSRFEWVDGSGHSPVIEQPLRVNELLDSFLGEKTVF